MRKKLIVDVSMAVIMLLLMTYGRIGEITHEWLGIFLVILVIKQIIKLMFKLQNQWKKIQANKKLAESQLFICLVLVLGYQVQIRRIAPQIH